MRCMILRAAPRFLIMGLECKNHTVYTTNGAGTHWLSLQWQKVNGGRCSWKQSDEILESGPTPEFFWMNSAYLLCSDFTLSRLSTQLNHAPCPRLFHTLKQPSHNKWMNESRCFPSKLQIPSRHVRLRSKLVGMKKNGLRMRFEFSYWVWYVCYVLIVSNVTKYLTSRLNVEKN